MVCHEGHTREEKAHDEAACPSGQDGGVAD